jgi:hypothetical protein
MEGSLKNSVARIVLAADLSAPPLNTISVHTSQSHFSISERSSETRELFGQLEWSFLWVRGSNGYTIGVVESHSHLRDHDTEGLFA